MSASHGMAVCRRAQTLMALAWAGLAFVQAPAVAQASAKLPQRNLSIELRWLDAAQRRADGAAARGGLVVGTTGTVDAQGQVVLRSGAREQSSDTVQRVLVLNGGRAGLRLTQSLPVQWLDLALTPRGPAASLQQGWMDSGASFDLLPRWPGGSAPVQVEVHYRVLAASGDVASPRSDQSMLSTLQLPLGEWVTVAQSAEQHDTHERGSLSTRDIERRSQRLLQMRVSLP